MENNYNFFKYTCKYIINNFFFGGDQLTLSRASAMSLCKLRSVSDVRCSLPMVDLSAIFIHFRLLKDLSAEQGVTGSVQSMCNSSAMFGKSELA